MLGLYLVFIDGEDGQVVFERLYMHHRKKLKQIARNILRDESWAEDAVHDTFVSVARHINRHPDQQIRSLKFYLYVSVKYKALSYLRRMKRETPTTHETIEEHINLNTQSLSDFASKATRDVVVKKLLSEIASLKTRDSEILTLYYVKRMRSQEVADTLGISNAAVRKRLERARKRLLRLYREKVGGSNGT